MWTPCKSTCQFMHIFSTNTIKPLWGQEGHKLVKEIGKKVMQATGETRSTKFLFQAISIAVQQGNASCVIGTVPHSEGLEEIFEFVSNS